MLQKTSSVSSTCYHKKISPLSCSFVRLHPCSIHLEHAYPEGKKVRFRDLVSRSDLNGERGTILDWLDSRQRYNIRVDNGEVHLNTHSFLFGRLQQPSRSAVRFQVIAVKAGNLSEIETIVKEESFWVPPSSAPYPPDLSPALSGRPDRRREACR